jgi:hypothetical protein
MSRGPETPILRSRRAFWLRSQQCQCSGERYPPPTRIAIAAHTMASTCMYNRACGKSSKPSLATSQSSQSRSASARQWATPMSTWCARATFDRKAVSTIPAGNRHDGRCHISSSPSAGVGSNVKRFGKYKSGSRTTISSSAALSKSGSVIFRQQG